MFRYNCYLCDFDLCSECINILLKDKELEVKVRVVGFRAELLKKQKECKEKSHRRGFRL